MTLPRELSLRQTADGPRLFQNPVAEVVNLRKSNLLISVMLSGAATSIPGALTELEVVIDLSKTTAKDLGFELRNQIGETYRLGFDANKNECYSDRTKAGPKDFSDNFATKRHTAPRLSKSKMLKMRIFFDTSSVELFADDGANAITDIFFPTKDFTQYKFYTNGDNAVFIKAEAWNLKSIWK